MSWQQQTLFGGRRGSKADTLRARHNGTDTSKAAAARANTTSDRDRVCQAVREAGAVGMTCDEVEEWLTLRHQTASARLKQLVDEGALKASVGRRQTRSGRSARVYVHVSVVTVSIPVVDGAIWYDISSGPDFTVAIEVERK